MRGWYFGAGPDDPLFLGITGAFQSGEDTSDEEEDEDEESREVFGCFFFFLPAATEVADLFGMKVRIFPNFRIRRVNCQK
jgi:hypothetical protein